MSALRGINLGGWLVVERWITPTLFQNTTAMTERELVASKDGRTKIARHHKTFITEDDIAWLADHGMQLLRVPVGYWIFGEEPEFVGSSERLDWLVDTAHHYGLQIVIDLHSAPGGQNKKQHNGGVKTVKDWLTDNKSQQETIAVLVRLAERYKNYSNIWGIELLNEPDGGRTGVRLARFYRKAYRALTNVARPGTRIIFSDAYSPALLTNTFGWFAHRDFPVVIDTHIYYVFGPKNKQRRMPDHLRMVRWSRWLLRTLSVSQPVMIGEWTAALPYGVSIETATEFLNTQAAVYDNTAAWCYWTYKTEGSGRWDYRRSFGA